MRQLDLASSANLFCLRLGVEIFMQAKKSNKYLCLHKYLYPQP
jgi:hypothetical protein